MRYILTLILAIWSSTGTAEPQSFIPYSEDLTQALETDALSALVSGNTYQIEAKLCQRIKGPVGQKLQTEFSAWETRNARYLKAAGKALTDLGDRYLPRGGDDARQGYFQNLAVATANESIKRVDREMTGANVANDVVPDADVCQYMAQAFHEGKLDFKNIPEEIVALDNYMQKAGK